MRRPKAVIQPEPLRTEVDTYEANKAALLRKAPGHCVVIKGRRIVGVFPTWAEAWREGYRRLRTPFLVRIILRDQPYDV